MTNDLTKILLHWASMTGRTPPLAVPRWLDSPGGQDIDTWAAIDSDAQSLGTALSRVVWPQGVQGPSTEELFAMLPDIRAAEALAAEAYEIQGLRLAISSEAERRIELGLQIPGVGWFRTRTHDVIRLQGLLKTAELAEAGQEPVAVTFMTEAGVSVTLTSSAEVATLFQTVSAHIAAILERSAALQAKLSTMTADERAAFDFSDPIHWASQ